MGKNKVQYYQGIVLKNLSGRINEFYLAGGTALSLFYFQHRLSSDLDFFTQEFSVKRIGEIVSFLRLKLNRKIRLIGQNLNQKQSKVCVYNISFPNKDALKIDFVEDVLPLIKPTKLVEGVKILSIEDIYLRKLYAISGMVSAIDEIGRVKTIGGRIDAKDFFDLYHLSHTFMAMSKFIKKYGSPVSIEGAVRWFRSYDRMKMMDEVLTLDTGGNETDYKKMEKHFKQEIDKIIEKQLEGI
jgi:predicted nucleotidyltransferase component of viral defense system